MHRFTIQKPRQNIAINFTQVWFSFVNQVLQYPDNKFLVYNKHRIFPVFVNFTIVLRQPFWVITYMRIESLCSLHSRVLIWSILQQLSSVYQFACRLSTLLSLSFIFFLSIVKDFNKSVAGTLISSGFSSQHLLKTNIFVSLTLK